MSADRRRRPVQFRQATGYPLDRAGERHDACSKRLLSEREAAAATVLWKPLATTEVETAMTGVLNQMAAREHALDLLCEAEQQRAAGGAQAGRPRVRRVLDGLLARRRRQRGSRMRRRGGPD
jgi:hypothetical protein